MGTRRPRELARASGGIGGLIRKLGEERAAIQKLRDAKLFGGTRQVQMQAAREKTWGAARAGVDDIARIELADAELAATCLVVALEVMRVVVGCFGAGSFHTADVDHTKTGGDL